MVQFYDNEPETVADMLGVLHDRRFAMQQVADDKTTDDLGRVAAWQFVGIYDDQISLLSVIPLATVVYPDKKFANSS